MSDEQLRSEQSNCAHVMVGRVCQKCGTVAGPASGTYEPPSEQTYSRWFTDWPSTHERAGQTVEVVALEAACLVEDVREALDAIDSYAAKDLDHELHSIVEHYRRALGCRS